MNTLTAEIFEIKRFAVHDGDGIRTTVFFKGCPLRCVWCHNPEGLSKDPQIAFYKHKCIGCGECKEKGFTVEDCLGDARVLYGKTVTVEQLIPDLLKDKGFYDNSGGGVTLSGGECLMQADFCVELLKALKANGIHTAVDTCGFVPKSALERVIPYTDVFLYDIKAYNEDVHINCTGVSNKLILDNLKYLDSWGANIEVRIPLVPEYNDFEISDIANFLVGLKNVSKVRVLPYHRLASSKYDALNIKSALPYKIPNDIEIEQAKNLIQSLTKLELG